MLRQPYDYKIHKDFLNGTVQVKFFEAFGRFKHVHTDIGELTVFFL